MNFCKRICSKNLELLELLEEEILYVHRSLRFVGQCIQKKSTECPIKGQSNKIKKLPYKNGNKTKRI